MRAMTTTRRSLFGRLFGFVAGAAVAKALPAAPGRDGPHLDRSSYMKGLSKIDQTVREQMLNGDWVIHGACCEDGVCALGLPGAQKWR
jgi:hypothetical protein